MYEYNVLPCDQRPPHPHWNLRIISRTASQLSRAEQSSTSSTATSGPASAQLAVPEGGTLCPPPAVTEREPVFRPENIRVTVRSCTRTPSGAAVRTNRRRDGAKSQCRRGLTFTDDVTTSTPMGSGASARSTATPAPGSSPSQRPEDSAAEPSPSPVPHFHPYPRPSGSSASSQPPQLGAESRRIVAMPHFWSEMQRLDGHNKLLDCRVEYMEIVRERCMGLRTCWTFKCRMCNVEMPVWSEPTAEGTMGVNHAATAGTVLTGGGHAQLDELCADMNMPCMSDKTFAKCEADVFEAWKKSAIKEMEQAVKEEIAHARVLGHVDADGTPLLTVTCDGSWPKRSNRTNYSSLSGMVSVTSTLYSLLI